MKRWAATFVVGLLAGAVITVAEQGSADTASGPVVYACIHTGTFNRVRLDSPRTCATGDTAVSWQGLPAAAPSPSPSTTGPAPSPSPSATSASPSPSATAPPGGACTAHLGGSCQFDWDGWPGSNGYNTYVQAQGVGPNAGTSETVTANSPSDWSDQASDVPAGYTGVQTFDAVQQLTNNWCGTGWGGCASPGNTPLSALSSLTVSYAESGPGSGAYEFAPDVWDTSAAADVMFWADTSPLRCTDNGLSASDIYGQATLGGQQWTVYHYGAEVIFILDGGASTDPVGDGTCAQQAAGTIDVLAGFQWLAAHGVQPGLGSLTQLNTGWEVCSAQGTFTVSALKYNVTVG